MSVTDLSRHRAEQSRTPWVRLTVNLETDLVLEPVYLRGSEGRVIEMEPTGKHRDSWPVLFENYSEALWVDRNLLDIV